VLTGEIELDFGALMFLPNMRSRRRSWRKPSKSAVSKTLESQQAFALSSSTIRFRRQKLAASIDQICGGRFLFGIGGGWNAGR